MKQKWTIDELIDSWLLLPVEEAVVNRHKTDTNRLGVALLLKLQLCLPHNHIHLSEPVWWCFSCL